MKSFFFNLDQWFRCRLKIFLIYSSGGPFVFGRAEPFVQFWYRKSNHFCEIILNLDQWYISGDVV